MILSHTCRAAGRMLKACWQDDCRPSRPKPNRPQSLHHPDFRERAMPLSQCLKAGCVAVLLLVGFLVAVSRAETLSPAAQRGRVFVQVNCAKCHAIGRIGDSPLSIAPA